MFKKLLALTLAVATCIGLGTTTLAAKTQPQHNFSGTQAITFNEKAENLEWHDYKDLDSIPIEDTYTYDELLAYLKDNGFTDEEAFNFAGERPTETRSTSIRYSLFKMDTFTYSGVYKLQAQFNAGLEYNAGSSSPNRIVSLKAAHIYTGGGKKCLFSGSIFYELIAGNEFYYNFYGDIYKEGNIQWSAGGTIGVGDNANLYASISNGSGYVTNVSEAESYYSPSLNA